MRPFIGCGVTVLLVCAFVACSGSTSSTSSSGGTGTDDAGSSGTASSGSSGNNPATQQVILDAKLVRGTHTATECPGDGQALTIGTFNPSVPVGDGTVNSSGGGQVTLSCKVAMTSGGFDMNANVQLAGTSGGELLLNAQLDAAGASMAGSVTFEVMQETYSASSCTLTIDPSTTQGVAVGRYGATLSCPGAIASTTSHVCDVEAQLRIENCFTE